MGAQFIHGITNSETGATNPIWTLGTQPRWPTKAFPDTAKMYRNGVQLSDEDATEVWDIAEEFLAFVALRKQVSLLSLPVCLFRHSRSPPRLCTEHVLLSVVVCDVSSAARW